MLDNVCIMLLFGFYRWEGEFLIYMCVFMHKISLEEEKTSKDGCFWETWGQMCEENSLFPGSSFKFNFYHECILTGSK